MSARGTGPAWLQGGRPGGAAAQDPAPTAELERRYRRLLRCFPPGHRELHLEEMLGVLMAAARPGQRTPGVAQAVNQAVCGLAIRGRRALSWLAGPWQDTLAVLSLVAPVLVFVVTVLEFASAVRVVVMVDPSDPYFTPNLVTQVGWPGALMIAWSVCSLAWSAGPRRGLAITGRRRACLMIAGLSAGFGFPSAVQLIWPNTVSTNPAITLLSILAAAAAIILTRVRTTTGWRVAALAGAEPAPMLVSVLTVPFAGELTAFTVLTSVTLLAALTVWPVAIASWRRRDGQTPRAAAR